MPELVLYKRDTCPYCLRVTGWIANNWPVDKPIKYRDTERDAGALEELIERGGKRQVPCLFIDGQPLYESLDIIAYLDSIK